MIEDQDNLIEVEEKLLISLYSYNATVKNNNSNLSNLTFLFQEPLVLDHGVLQANMSILSFTCPNSQYIINDTNNQFLIYVYQITPIDPANPASTLNYDQLLINLTNGYYNATTYINMFLTAINSNSYTSIFTMVYNSVTGCYSLTCNRPFFLGQYQVNDLPNSTRYKSVSNIGTIMGFDDSQYYIPGVYTSPVSYVLDFPYPCNFGGLNSLNITIGNIKTKALKYIYKTKTQDRLQTVRDITPVESNQNIAISVPVNCNSGEVIYYNKLGTFEFNFKDSIIDRIDVQLTDDLGNLLQLNNQNWNMTLEINLTKVIHKKTRNFFEIIQNPFPKVSYIPQY